MTIDEAIKHAEEAAEEHTRYNRYGGFESWNDVNCTECAKEHRQLANWLKELKQLRKQTRWIPVSERLPKTDNWRTAFNVTTKQGKVMPMEWENTTVRGKPVSRWIWNDRIAPWEVIAWMPLPEPYKEESEE